MKDILDIHMHSIASGHAYSTVREMSVFAKQRGLQIMGLADHGPAMPGAPHEVYFHNLKAIKRVNYGIRMLMGIELNIMDYNGGLDLTPKMRRNLDYAVASLHELCLLPGSKEQNTAAIIGAMQDPLVKVIGHPDNGNYPVDFEAIVKAAKEYHVLLEVNNSSYKPKSSRKNSRELSQIMLKYCKEYGVSVIMDSDAHVDAEVGYHPYSIEILRKADFPEELVVNTDIELFRKFIPFE